MAGEGEVEEQENGYVASRRNRNRRRPMDKKGQDKDGHCWKDDRHMCYHHHHLWTGSVAKNIRENIDDHAKSNRQTKKGYL